MEYYLMTDASVHTQSGVGVGAYLWLNDLTAPLPALTQHIKTRQFSQTSSSLCELQTLLWALDSLAAEIEPFKEQPHTITLYTDCQNIIGLPARRKNLEAKNFCNAQKIQLKHAELYRQFFHWLDDYNIQPFKIKGHMPTRHKNTLDKIFALVDHEARTVLRAGL